MRPSEIAKDFYPAQNQCKDCIFFPKCDEYPFDESGCDDFKDRSRFVELPCRVGDTVYQADSIRIYPLTIKKLIYDAGHIAFDEEAIGKSIFLTPEEAERKMNDA